MWIILKVVLLLIISSCNGFGLPKVFAPFVENFIKNNADNKVERRSYLSEYDFIVVGSGPAGCVLANRLTENKDWNVLLIEAGTVETFVEQVPMFAPYEFLTRYNWGYLAERQPYSCLGSKDGRCGFPRGKALGGTSVINGMLYTRGSKEDFDTWVNLGNYGWDYYETVLPAFKKSERARLKFYHKSQFHNDTGYLSVVHNEFQTPIPKIFIDGNKAMGLDEIDYNADENIGVSYLQSNTLKGRRHSAYRSFIEPFLHRKNLHIMLNTRVTRVLIDSVTRIAYGVELLRKNRRHKIIARREVILSAGTFHSPQLLQLSGIGPREDLHRIGVPLLHDLPVGKEMYDHVSFPGLLFRSNLTNPILPFLEIQNTVQILGSFLQGKGFGTIPNGVESLAFIQTPTSNVPHPRLPNIELLLLTVAPHYDNGYAVKDSERMSDWLYDSVYKQLEGDTTYSFLIVISLLHPKSVGYLELKDRNIFNAPKFYSNFLKDPQDVESILEAVKYVVSLTKTKPFQNIGTRLHDVPIPTCAKYGFGSDDYWRCAIRTWCVTLHHQVGTCKMGPSEDSTAIVNPELKVYGVKRLRVIDTSIIPISTTSHTCAASYMIGEVGADMIKRDWERQSNPYIHH
ncbi:glucose dehydrogenase [FAD, quinone]-like isoform X1 [Chironomus tepperi]|uniref:glucose dehydrogenase [FAD, quinone]-like isoform X1 n=1 Tax=Chironomus tepperi TaxID=113505 RepID=UPI00391F5D4B